MSRSRRWCSGRAGLLVGMWWPPLHMCSGAVGSHARLFQSGGGGVIRAEGGSGEVPSAAVGIPIRQGVRQSTMSEPALLWFPLPVQGRSHERMAELDSVLADAGPVRPARLPRTAEVEAERSGGAFEREDVGRIARGGKYQRGAAHRRRAPPPAVRRRGTPSPAQAAACRWGPCASCAASERSSRSASGFHRSAP